MDEMAVDVNERTGIVLRHDVVVPDLVVQGAGSVGGKEGRSGSAAGGRLRRRGKGVDSRRQGKEEGHLEAGGAKSGHGSDKFFWCYWRNKAKQPKKERIRSNMDLPVVVASLVRRHRGNLKLRQTKNTCGCGHASES